MADALCGPSNPLQSFRKHTQLDRTLQQDRIVGRSNSAREQFRSHDPRAGSLDADLHAFENSQPNPLEFQQPPAFFQQPAPPPAGWAADFQRLHISHTPSPVPVPVSQFRAEAPLIKTTNGGWHNDFLRQSGNATPVMASSKGKEAMRTGHDMQQQSQFSMQDPMWDRMSSTQQSDHSFQLMLLEQENKRRLMMDRPSQEQGHLRGHQFVDISDDAFEAAFQDAFMAEAQALQQQEPSPLLQPQQEPGHDLPQSDLRIGSDAINYTAVKDRTAEQDTRDADELARTAGQLLNLVQHDTSQKFQNSQFLELMRQLRDREVEVQNNDMVSATNGISIDTMNDLQLRNQPNVEQHQDPYPAATEGKDSQWQFPDMNDIYAPANNDLDTGSRAFSGSVPPMDRESRMVGWINRPSSVPPGAASRSQMNDPMYQTGSDEFPASQIQALHPGGRNYPHSPRQQKAEMSGAVSQGISVDDFETGFEESSSLGRRFGSP